MRALGGVEKTLTHDSAATAAAISAFYDRAAHRPDMHRDIFGVNEFVGQLDFWPRGDLERIADIAGFAPGHTLLDIGCGLGGPACFFADRYGVSVLGIDLTTEYVELARTRATRMGLQGRAVFEMVDAAEWSPPKACFDAAISIDSLVHVKNLARCMEHIRRALKGQGRLVVAAEAVTPEAPAELIARREKLGKVVCRSEADLLSALEGAGFVFEQRFNYPDKRGEFAAAAVAWMDRHDQEAGRESMQAILELAVGGWVTELLICVRAG